MRIGFCIDRVRDPIQRSLIRLFSTIGAVHLGFSMFDILPLPRRLLVPFTLELLNLAVDEGLGILYLFLDSFLFLWPQLPGLVILST